MSNIELKPTYMADMMAFMFESTYFLRLTDWALQNQMVRMLSHLSSPHRPVLCCILPQMDQDYYKCWDGVGGDFDPANPEPEPAGPSSKRGKA